MFLKNSSFNVLYTEDIQATHDFYKKIGAEIEKIEDDKVVVTLGDFNLHFILANTEPFKEYEYIAKKNDYGNGVLFYIEVEDIEKLFSFLEDSTKSSIKPNHWQCREFLLEDNNGYKFVFYS
jgi:predicted lactoylglutathione lyase